MLRCKRLSVFIVFGCFAILMFLLLEYNVCNNEYSKDFSNVNGNCITTAELTNSSAAKAIACNADNGELIQCLYDGSDIYFPFEKFLKSRFEVFGKLVKGEKSHFELRTSYVRMKTPNTLVAYDPFGHFGQFAFYSVETRDRVRCISAKSGIPMSTQWSPKPYYYPIQIAQFALQHYSRYKTSLLPQSYTFTEYNIRWKLDGKSQTVYKTDSIDNELYIHINALENTYEARLELLQNTSMVVVMFEWSFSPEASFSVFVEVSGIIYEIHYIQKEDDRCVWSESDHKIFYTLGDNFKNSNWRKINRNVLVDLDRGLIVQSKNHKGGAILHPGDVKPLWLSFYGKASIRKLKQQSSSNLENFIVAANWFVRNQDTDGGWSVPIERRVVNNRLFLSSGWHSAMAQGQALSVLTRAYKLLNDSMFLDVAGKALKIFQMEASEGGVLNKIFGNNWYEEYPTVPGTYVLNGFMYALIGLYDFSQTPNGLASKAKELFDDGIRSLEIILPLYDTGSGTMYDLRHITLKMAPNLARWDYHAVHVYLLKWLSGITSISYFNEIADRWIDYANGKRAKHN